MRHVQCCKLCSSRGCILGREHDQTARILLLANSVPYDIHVFGRWGKMPNERVITARIGWVLLASATSRISGYIKLAYCSSAKGLQ